MTSIFRTPFDHLGRNLSPRGSVSLTSATLSTNNTRLAWVFQAETANPFTALGFRLTTITNGGSMPTYRLSLQGVSGSGFPDGTIKGSGNSAFVTFVPTVANGFANNTFTWQTLGTAYTPASVGEALALVLDVSSGTANGSNNIAAVYVVTGVVGDQNARPYALFDANLTWAGGDLVLGAPVWGYKTASEVCGNPVEAVSSTSVTSTTEVALRFTLPAALGSTFQLLGGLWNGTTQGSGDLCRLSLYSGGESSPSLLEQVELDSDWVEAVGGSNRWTDAFFDDAAATLSFGTQYHLGLSVQTNSMTVNHFLYNVASDMQALPWGDSAFCLATRTVTYPPGSGGNVFASSTAQTKTRPVLLPILSDWTAPAGTTFDGVLINTVAVHVQPTWAAIGNI